MPERDAPSTLETLCETTLRHAPSPALAGALAELRAEIDDAHGGAGVALLLYGSAFRQDREGGPLEGVPDLIYVVDTYESAYRARRLRWANTWLPPNVFPLFARADGRNPLRAKYALISLGDLERQCGDGALDAFVWARLCQPSALVWVRDEPTRRRIARACARAVETMLTMALPVAAGRRSEIETDADALWTRAFDETYRGEWRFEGIRRRAALAAADRAYYEAAAQGAIEGFEAKGWVRRVGDRWRLDPEWARAARRQWAWRRRRGKALAALRLVKSALTFGDWVPYALWKMERHTGVRLEATASQRRHPFLLGWPLIVRALRGRLLR